MVDKNIADLIRKHLSPYFENKNIPQYIFEPIREIVKERTRELQEELKLWDGHVCNQIIIP